MGQVWLGALALGLGLMAACDSGNKEAPEGGEAEGTPEAEAGAEPASPVTTLVSAARTARHSLDVATLQEVEGELEAAGSTADAQRERLAALATLAVEARVRSAALHDEQAAARATALATEGQTLADSLAGQLDPGELAAAEARLALARDEDVLAEHPAVLLPSFRDRELQHAVLSRPVWSGDEESLAEPERAQLVETLQALSEPSGLEQLLLAVTLDAAGEPERAAEVAQRTLGAAPEQPLAKGLLDRIRDDGRVAVADPAPAKPEPEPAKPEPEATKPEPEATKPEPEATKPEATKPEPETTKPEPEPAKPRPKPKLSPEELTTEGCKEVRSGNAKKGFAMLQRAFDLDPRDTKVTLCMAEGHMKLGRLPSGRAMVERVLRASPKNKKALLLAGKIEDKLGNKKSAVEYYRRVLAIDPGNATAQGYVDKNG